MKNQELKLEFIENGRLANCEMSEVVGGSESCGTYTPCPAGETNKGMCNRYRDCESIFDKFKCTTYNDFVIGFDYIYDSIENIWYEKAAI